MNIEIIPSAGVEADAKVAAIKAYDKGLEYRNKKKPDLAINCFTFSIMQDPDNHLAYLNRGLLHLYAKNFDLAADDFINTLNLEPTHNNSYAELKKCLITLHQKTKFVGIFEKIKKLKPAKLQSSLLRACLNSADPLGTCFGEKEQPILQEKIPSYLFALEDKSCPSGNSIWFMQGPQIINKSREITLKDGRVATAPPLTSDLFKHISTFITPEIKDIPSFDNYLCKVHRCLLFFTEKRLSPKEQNQRLDIQESNFHKRTTNVLSNIQQQEECQVAAFDAVEKNRILAQANASSFKAHQAETKNKKTVIRTNNNSRNM